MALNISKNEKFKIFNNEIYERHVLFRYFFDCEVIEQGQRILYNWIKTPAGDWCNTYSKQIEITTTPDYLTNQTSCVVTGYISPKRWTEFCLKFIDTLEK